MTEPIYTCLWFENKALEAATYYCSIFPYSKILSQNPVVVIFELNRRKFMALNGRRQFEFNESLSLVVTCDKQEEIDYYWSVFTKEGEESKCGWLKDKFGLSWQIVPSQLGELMNNSKAASKVSEALFKMTKLNISILQAAASES